MSTAMKLRLQNIASAWAVIGLACALFIWAPHNSAGMGRHYELAGLSFSGAGFMLSSASLYSLLVAAWYLSRPVPEVSKSLCGWRVILRFVRGAGPWPLAEGERLALLTTLLKGFFAPLMVFALMQFCVATLAHGTALLASNVSGESLLPLFNRHGHWFVLKLLYFLDVLVFTVGYLVEIPRLGNTIRSVETRWLGWAAALVCYPPINQLTNAVLGGQVSDFPQFANPVLHVLLNTLMLLCLLGYTFSSLALGLKASNLTHRGIVSRGVYRWVRHPAYACKNAAWLIGSLPAILVSFGDSLVSGLLAVAAVVGWASIYVLRALTEEDHLRRVDGEYAAYAARVRYRFVPGLL